MLFYEETISQEEEGSESEGELEEEMEGREEERSLEVERRCLEVEGRTLALTLEEVRHIRTALTRAELEVTTQSSKLHQYAKP